MSNTTFYNLRNIWHAYAQEGGSLQILQGIDLAIQPGEMVALMGPSGAGKSTLLHIAGLLDVPDTGEVIIQGRDCSHLSDHERTLLRRHRMGFVYQFHHLLPEFSAYENLIVPQKICGIRRSIAHERAIGFLSLVELSHRLSHRPAHLSGGERQRVAIARALVNEPAVLIADEPTGNLDEHTGSEIFHLLQQLARTKNLSVLMATHNAGIAKKMDRVLTLRNGRL